MYKLNIQKKAQKDAERIYDYIRFILFNPIAAYNFILCLEKRYDQIKNNPHGFKTEWINAKPYKKAHVKKYVIIFALMNQAVPYI